MDPLFLLFSFLQLVSTMLYLIISFVFLVIVSLLALYYLFLLALVLPLSSILFWSQCSHHCASLLGCFVSWSEYLLLFSLLRGFCGFSRFSLIIWRLFCYGVDGVVYWYLVVLYVSSEFSVTFQLAPSLSSFNHLASLLVPGLRRCFWFWCYCVCNLSYYLTSRHVLWFLCLKIKWRLF